MPYKDAPSYSESLLTSPARAARGSPGAPLGPQGGPWAPSGPKGPSGALPGAPSGPKGPLRGPRAPSGAQGPMGYSRTLPRTGNKIASRPSRCNSVSTKSRRCLKLKKRLGTKAISPWGTFSKAPADRPTGFKFILRHEVSTLGSESAERFRLSTQGHRGFEFSEGGCARWYPLWSQGFAFYGDF